MTGTIRFAHSVAVIMVLAGAAPGQIVDIQGNMSSAPEEGTSASIALAAQIRSGQAESILVGAGGSIEHYLPGHHFYFSTAIEWGETEGSTYVDRRFAHLRYRRPRARLGQSESFIQAETDGLRGLRARHLAGTGLRWELGEETGSRVSLGVAGMWEHEYLVDGGNDGRSSTVRLSSYVSGGWSISEGWTLNSTSYVQPKATDTSDLRLLSDTTLRVAPGGRAALETRLHLAYDTRPPTGVERGDLVLKQGLSWSF